MRICHILARPLSRSTATMEFIKAEIAAGMETYVVCPVGPPSLLDNAPKVTLTTLEVEGIKRFSIRRSWHYIQLVLDNLQGQTFDVVLVETFRGSGLLPIWGKQAGKLWLTNIRNSNLKSSGLKAALADRLTVWETLPYDASIVCDVGIGQRLFGKKEFHVVPNGADLLKFASGERVATRAKLGYADADRVIVYIGTMVSSRRPTRMLETFAQVAAVHPEARLLMVGDSDILPDLVAWTHTHHLADRVTFTGRVPYGEVQNYLAAADIGFAYYPNLATYKANIPLKTSEFLAASLPTVATDTEGNRIYITHGENGLLAEDDPAQLAKEMLRLFDEPELAERLRRHAKPSVMEYDWQQIAQNTLFPLYGQMTAVC